MVHAEGIATTAVAQKPARPWGRIRRFKRRETALRRLSLQQRPGKRRGRQEQERLEQNPLSCAFPPENLSILGLREQAMGYHQLKATDDHWVIQVNMGGQVKVPLHGPHSGPLHVRQVREEKAPGLSMRMSSSCVNLRARIRAC